MLGVVGLWFPLPGVLSLFGTGPGEVSSVPVPAMGTGAILGVILVAGALLLWRCGARSSRG